MMVADSLSIKESDLLEPIAVVGLALRFPQDARNVDGFWDMLMRGKCASTEFPPDRLNVDAFHRPGSTEYNSVSNRDRWSY